MTRINQNIPAKVLAVCLLVASCGETSSAIEIDFDIADDITAFARELANGRAAIQWNATAGVGGTGSLDRIRFP